MSIGNGCTVGFFMKLPAEQDAYLKALVDDGKFLSKQEAVRHLIGKAMEGAPA